MGHAKSHAVSNHFNLLLLMVIRTKFSFLLSFSGNFKIIAYNSIAIAIGSNKENINDIQFLFVTIIIFINAF